MAVIRATNLLSDDARPATAGMRRVGPSTAGEHAAQVDGQLARGDGHVDPERPHREPSRSGAATIADTVGDPGGPLVSQSAVQLHENLRFLIGDVVQPESAGHARCLSMAFGQPVRSLDVTEEEHLHHALRATADIGENVVEQPSSTVPTPRSEEAPEAHFRREPRWNATPRRARTSCSVPSSARPRRV
jgi:hypothetical protein